MSRAAGVLSLLTLVAIALLPVVVAVLPAFRAPASEGWSASSFAYVVETYGDSLKTSLVVAVLVVSGSLLVGVPAAIGLKRYSFRGSGLLARVAEVPLALPGVSVAVALLLLYGRFRGSLFLVCGGIMLYTVPYVIRIVANAIDAHAMAELESAGRTLGATQWTAFLRISLPLLGRPALIGALAVFALAWGEFNVSFLLATPLQTTFSAALHGTFTSNSPEVSGAALLLFLGGAAPILLAFQVFGDRIIGQGQRV